ncbi:50S ribosomal protein L23 [Buchnera aphidicola (Eriosoma lanigerum)]|uniref:50S ribosomal protein L23 n=1 Tax=Buchnera aphidicola TaxID=9 RepID=UPI003A72E51B
MNNDKLFKVLLAKHISEKSSMLIEKKHTVVLKVDRSVNKFEIKTAIQKLFNIKVKNVNTLIVKGKNKKNRNHIIYGKKWKKAYVSLYKGENIDFIGIGNK